MTDHRTKLQDLLRELFQLDLADLDYGIYRIMKQRRAEIEAFIQKGLLDAVAEEFKLLEKDVYQQKNQALEQAAAELRGAYGDDAIDDKGELTVEPRYLDRPVVQKYKALREQVRDATVSAEAEAEIFNALYTFFSRYYDEGDFIAQHRYSRTNKYAIPYNGEEVYLYWANRDQYYVKTADVLTDYAFVISSHGGYRVAFKLASADTEQNNVKGEKRFFLPVKDGVSQYDSDKRELAFFFEYRPLTDKEPDTYGKTNTQVKILEASHDRLLKAVEDKTLRGLLAAIPEGKEVSLLAIHLTRWTRKSTSDYFIHKDLRGFLRRELDFYLKNEVMRLDDIDTDHPAPVERYLTRLKVIKGIAVRIIDFLTQIEDFQKQLFEKPKFVLASEWCVTLDRVPEELYPIIAANEAQWAEWEHLFGVKKPKGDAKKAKPFFKEHPYLTIDTAFYDATFKDELLAALSDRGGDLAVQSDGLLIHGENFQALNLLLPTFQRCVNCIYIDPPYNTGTDDFIYKDNYQHSSWLSMMENRLRLARELLSDDGLIMISINDGEEHTLRMMSNGVFGSKSS